MAVAVVGDWLDRLRGRLYAQFRDQPVIDVIVQIAADLAQPIEDTLSAMANRYAIEPVTDDAASASYWIGRGAQLDLIGRIVGQPRGTLTDDLYRFYLRAKIRANRSSGTVADLYDVLRALLGFRSTFSARIETSYPAGFILHLDAPPISPPEADAAILFLRRAKLAAVWLVLIYQPEDDEHTFSFAGGPGRGFGSATDLSPGGALSGALG